LEENLSVKTVGGSFDAFHVLPSVTPAPVVVVLPEIFGVNADLLSFLKGAAITASA